MAVATIACPHCGFSKEMEKRLLPRAGATVNCPKCLGKFPLAVSEGPAAAKPSLGATDPSPAAMEPSSAATEPAAIEAADAQGREEGWQPFASAAPTPPAPDSLPPAPGISLPQRPRTLTLSFTGNAKEYFGIWIVNTLLRIVTLGIYSPWAKVRKRRYFYGNTLLDDANFDYLADPLAILKGWFIAGACFGLYSFASNVSPVAASVLMLLFFALSPWVIVRSQIFNLRNSSHRNIRFSFRPNYDDAYKVFLWWPMLVPLTLGIIAPYVMYRQKRFLVENSAFGTTFFEFDATAKQYYRAFIPVLVLAPIMIGATFCLIWQVKGAAPLWATLALTFCFLAFYFMAWLYLPTAITNLTWSATSIGGHRFESKLRVRDMAWIHISSAVAVLCTLGLLAPWAAVRLARYRLNKLTLTGVGGLNTIVAAENQAMGATGEELGDMFGFDMGL